MPVGSPKQMCGDSRKSRELQCIASKNAPGIKKSPSAHHKASRVSLNVTCFQGATVMTNFTRRWLLSGAAAASTVGAITSFRSAPVRAAAPTVGKQAPGVYRYKIGDIEVTVVTDGVIRGKLPDNLVTNVPTEEVKAALVAAHLDRDTFSNTFTPIIVNTGGRLVLIDTGVGEAGFKQTNGTAGQF